MMADFCVAGAPIRQKLFRDVVPDSWSAGRFTPLSKGADATQSRGGILANETHARLVQIVPVCSIMLEAWQAGLAVWTDQHGC